MQHTQNFNFELPEASEYAAPANSNFEKLDAELAMRPAVDPETDRLPAEVLPEMDYEPPLANADPKETPADGDSLALVDSGDSNKTKRLLWSKVKEIFAPITHSHVWSDISGKPTSFKPSTHASTHKSGGPDALTAGDIGAATKAAYTASSTVAGWTQDPTNGWYSQAISVPGLLEADVPLCDCVLTGDHDADLLITEAWSLVTRAVAVADAVTFYAYGDAPSVSFSVKMEVVRNG